MDRRTFIHCGAGIAGFVGYGSAVLGKSGKCCHGSGSIFELDIERGQTMMQSGELTAVAWCQYFLDRIRDLDQKGPSLHAVLEVNPDALKIAEEMDQYRKEHGPLSPLHGVPVLIKANIDSGDRMETTAGSLALTGMQAPEDAFIVKQLRKAGAVLLGKTNLSEWANFRSTRSSSGWSSHGGQTHNPYALDRSPCGSSSGSGVAVAADLCAVAIGTETDGSIVCPSGINGVVGIKPTIGLVSRSGIIPLSHSQDTAGPMARTVKDAAALLSVMAGKDEADSVTLGQPKKMNYAQNLVRGALKGKRLGVPRQMARFHKEVTALYDSNLKTLTDLGAVLVDPVEFTSMDDMDKDEFTVLLYEFKSDLNAYLKKRGVPEHVGTLEKLIEFNNAHADKVMPWFGQELFTMAQEKGPLSDEDYKKALANCKRISQKEGIDKLIAEHKLDAFVIPTNGPSWNIDLINGDHYGGGSSSLPAVSGYPSITVPAGYVKGLPIGLTFFGPAFAEEKLIQLAYDFEQESMARKPPMYRTHIGP